MILHHLYLIRIRRESEGGRTADPQIATKACSADVCRGGRPMPPRAPMRKNSKPYRGSRFGGSKPKFFKTDGREKQRKNNGKTTEKQRKNSEPQQRETEGFERGHSAVSRAEPRGSASGDRVPEAALRAGIFHSQALPPSTACPSARHRSMPPERFATFVKPASRKMTVACAERLPARQTATIGRSRVRQAGSRALREYARAAR